MQLSLSVIIPTFNEVEQIEHLLDSLAQLRAAGAEVVVADGGSKDGTLDRLKRHVPGIELVRALRGRARQMNAGAHRAQGDWLLFLHADTRLPPDVPAILAAVAACGAARWGFFPVKLNGQHWPLRIVETMMCVRSRVSCVATGDQALFVRRDLFEQLRGYADIPLMEDIELSGRLRKHCRPVIPNRSVVTSSRRWESQGITRTVLTMWFLRGAYACGVSPQWLVKQYYGSATTAE